MDLQGTACTSSLREINPTKSNQELLFLHVTH